ncbi:ABC transporter ATP-binding protein [Sporosarcina trichiuri]|uniref:ABC transporter ATP-binding protein n=1 Tax=Sporosarcina trichiuri TaxID=3056445 RepID=UPI0025B30AE9|nr:ATP-binding cassette domain-containing protein [Sporosarcina sp. 0.2-SM1T-5]WJY26565.1 ATP-binding cassette domain-containing protein [Sporosarcina sp. 0.2-SM1T-5]
MTLIELKNVSKSYKGLILFDKINLQVEEGEIYGIIGHNGSGKSVLFKLICGFVLPDNGAVFVRGQELGKSIRFPDGFGIIIDRPGYLPNSTGFENLKSLAMIKNEISDEVIRNTMIRVGLQPDIEQKVKNYSLGMKQKLALAQAIMEDQKVLILDEPFNALDFDSVKKIRELLLACKKEGKTIILTSHNQDDINLLCDKVYRINNCKLDSL